MMEARKKVNLNFDKISVGKNLEIEWTKTLIKRFDKKLKKNNL